MRSNGKKRRWLNVLEAAGVIGCTDGRVRQMLRDGVLRGEKLHSRAWLIPPAEAERVRDISYGRGRPRKNSA